ncbi:MAG: glycosyltransferase [Caulobacteraceae bacterium]
MKRRHLAVVANFHRERRLGAKTARFLAAAHAHLRARGIDLNVEFVLDRPDDDTARRISAAASAMDGARLHRLDSGDLGVARAHGVRHARGDVVCFMDGDDFFSMNWFETALEALSGPPRREIVHTQYLVSFGDEQFIRETMDSRDPAFDPLSLAVDWYWNGNLAIPTRLFEEVPIEPYDHDAGFGSEDWHWSCNGLAAGIARVPLPGTCYYYRIKPAKLALGRVAEVIYKRSALFDHDRLPAPPSKPTAKAPPVSDLQASFFAQAKEIETFELGVSYLRAIDAAALTVKRFKPHTPPLIGQILREAYAAGFGEGSTIVFADVDRVSGGMPTIAAVADVLSRPPAAHGGGAFGATRLYVVEGDGARRETRPDGYVISVAELRAAGLNQPRRERLIARFLIQSRDLTVVNLLSPRFRSLALGYSRATRGSVSRWINVVTEYGLDALSQAWEEIDAFRVGGIAAHNIGIFEKTVREAAAIRGEILLHDARLEAEWVGVRSNAHRSPPPVPELLSQARPRSGEARVVRLALQARDGGLSASEGRRLREVASAHGECLLVLGSTRLGTDLGEEAVARAAGLQIPALTVICRGDQPNFNLRHPIERLNDKTRDGSIPAELLLGGAVGIDSQTVRATLAFDDRPPTLGHLLRAGIATALAAGLPAIGLLAPTSITYLAKEDLSAIDVVVLARAMNGGAERGERDA